MSTHGRCCSADGGNPKQKRREVPLSSLYLKRSQPRADYSPSISNLMHVPVRQLLSGREAQGSDLHVEGEFFASQRVVEV